MLVGGVDIHLKRSIFGPKHAPCITLHAPGGGLGNPIFGAAATSDNDYSNIIVGELSAAPLVAGVAAQYLSVVGTNLLLRHVHNDTA